VCVILRKKEKNERERKKRKRRNGTDGCEEKEWIVRNHASNKTGKKERDIRTCMIVIQKQQEKKNKKENIVSVRSTSLIDSISSIIS
jgi:hypothetical protein